MTENVLFSSGYFAGSDYRELLLYHAKDAYENGDIESSIFYQIKSLCTEFKSRYNVATEENDSQTTKVIREKTQPLEESPVVKYALKYLKGKDHLLPKLPNRLGFLENVKDSAQGMQQVHTICSSLPTEWTVIQLCKEHRTDTTYSTFREIIAADAAIYLSILKHPRSEEHPEPICLRLTSGNQSRLFEKFSVLTSSFTEFSTYTPCPVSSQELQNYWAGMDILERRLADAVAELKSFMGPWVSLLCGNMKSKHKEKQEALFKAVDKFCDANDIDCQQRVILSLLAQQRHLLTDEHMRQASVELASNECHEEGSKETPTSTVIYEFLTQIPSEGEIEFGPCILVLDERIDHFYWEVLNPWQELCRMSSFHILARLFERYRSKIKNGYLMVDVEKGRCVVNPDSNLPNMEERMKMFFNYWLPDWKCSYGVVPQHENFMNIFDEADCYIYCGHGSGLQYINGRKISKFQMKCVVFLFGCDSVRLRSQGLHSEMTASHLYYHAALCPAIVGTLQLAFDFQVDKIATTLLSEWIPSSTDDVVHWHYVDKASWKKGTIKVANLKNRRLPLDSYEGSLAKAVCTIHQKTEEKLYNTVGFVYRGLPVWNSHNSHIKGG